MMSKDTPFLPNKQLREARLRRGWSQQYIANQVGTAIVTVNRWERGSQSPNPYFRLKLCTLFDKSAEELGLLPDKRSSLSEEASVSTSIESLPSMDSCDPQDATTQLNDEGIDLLTVPSLLHQESQTPHPTAQQKQNRTRILRRLHHYYSTLLEQSLQGSAWIDGEFSQKSDAVRTTTTLLVRSAHQEDRPLPHGTSIMQVYEDAERELLILGEPGAGKSTLLLQLARHLVENATLDDTHPLPVIFPLSSWAVKRPALEDWIGEQLTLIYTIPPRLAQQWMQEEHILPLLDGLDEMEEAARPACIAAINAYHCEHLVPLVVCSRMNEYTTAALSERLLLHRAVIVQPLSTELVDTYLATMGKPLAALRTTLRENSAMQALATTPLMLHILMLTFSGVSAQNLSHEEAQLQTQLWTAYVERMVTSKGDAKRYPLDITRTWLGWLARQMRRQNQTIFYLEQVQPDWLEHAHSRRVYQHWAVLLPNVLAAGLLGVLASTLFFSSYFSLEIIVFLFMIAGALLTRQGNEITERPRKTLWQRLWLPLCTGIGGGLGAALISFLTHNGSTIYHWQNGLSYGVAIALLCILLRRGHPHEALRPFSWSWGGIKQWFLTNMYRRDGLSIGLSCAIGFGLHELFRRGLLYAFGEGLRYGLLMGGTGVLLSVLLQVLQVRKEVIEPKEALESANGPEWSWRKAWYHLFAWKHLKNTLLVGSSVAFIMAMNLLIRSVELQQRFIWQREEETVIGYGISIGLMALSIYWLQQWYRGGLPQELLPEATWLKPNQRIWSFARHAALLAVISTLMGWLIYASSYNPYTTTGGDGSKYTLLFGFLFGLAAGALSGLLYGGLICLRHLVVRVLLWRTHVFSWKATTFLEDATARILLRRVGSGYSFTHRLLLDHFADLKKNLHTAETGTIKR